MRPRMDTARLALVTHEKMTRSARTWPLTASTFSAPKKRSRAAMVSWLTPWPRAATDGESQPIAAHSMEASAKKTRVIIGFLLFIIGFLLQSSQDASVVDGVAGDDGQERADFRDLRI